MSLIEYWLLDRVRNSCCFEDLCLLLLVHKINWLDDTAISRNVFTKTRFSLSFSFFLFFFFLLSSIAENDRNRNSVWLAAAQAHAPPRYCRARLLALQEASSHWFSGCWWIMTHDMVVGWEGAVWWNAPRGSRNINFNPRQDCAPPDDRLHTPRWFLDTPHSRKFHYNSLRPE